jgi:hypothetical protein
LIASLLLAVTLSQMHECIDELDPLVEREHVPTWSGHASQQCTVKVETLATKKGASLLVGWYRWPLSWLPKYSVVTFVAYEREKGSDVVTPLLTRIESEESARFDGVAMTAVNGERVLEIVYCLNGTGGCGQEFFAWRKNALVPLATNYRDAFNRKLPRGMTTYKSPDLDLKTMTIRGGGWRDGKDSNCCPSIIMKCKVSLIGDKAQLAACRIANPQDE